MTPTLPRSQHIPIFDKFLGARKSAVLGIALVMIGLISITDFFTGADVSLGVLYVLPVGVAATAFDGRIVVALSLACAILRTALVDLNGPADALSRGALSFVANVATGYLIIQLTLTRRLMAEHLREVEHQQSLRREAEDQLRALADGSPAAIFTLDANGRILSGNRAARTMFALDREQPIEGLDAARLLPVLRAALAVDMPSSFLSTAAQSQGRRLDGEAFVAQTWFSTYESGGGKRLAAIAVDCSEEVREREEQNLRQLLDNNRIVAAAVSHEIRNVCAAVSAVYSNLRRNAGLAGNEDFEAMGVLVATLERIAAVDLRATVTRDVGVVDIAEVLDHLSVIIAPSWEECDGKVAWQATDRMPLVRGEPFGLIQAFLNLSQNSLRAVAALDVKEFRVRAGVSSDKVSISFTDSGPGVRDPSALFQPFQSGAESAGLGLYVSRAILRGYSGDLRYEPVNGECRFVVDLAVAQPQGSAK